MGKMELFQGMLNDRVTLVKEDGTVAKEDVPALVQPKLIVMDDTSLPLQPGDRLLRSLPSGLVEEFIVEEPGFYSGLHGMKAHFQAKVRRSDTPAAQPQTIINNIQGQNARVNINSTDNSQNAAVSFGESELFDALRKQLDESEIAGPESDAIRETISKMENAESKQSFKESYQEFMATAANHVAVFGPLLGALAGLL